MLEDNEDMKQGWEGNVTVICFQAGTPAIFSQLICVHTKKTHPLRHQPQLTPISP